MEISTQKSCARAQEKHNRRVLTALPLAILWFLASPSMSAPSAVHLIENFESFKPGTIPEEGWQSRNGEPQSVYNVIREGENQFLRAVDTGQSIQFFRKGSWSLREYPILTWKWRVHVFPDGSDERMGSKNDSAAAVYVLFPRRWFVPEV